MKLLSQTELHICHRCMRGWEHFGPEKTVNCDNCGKPRAVYYRHDPLDDLSKYYKHLDDLLRYLGKEPRMNIEPMEEIDFSPLQAVIEEQRDTIRDLSEQNNQLIDEKNDLLVEQARLERDIEDLRDIFENISSEIAKALR